MEVACENCHTQIARALNLCPGCGVLVHRARLRDLQARAVAQEQAGQLGEALTLWRDALGLLPESAPQHKVILAKVTDLSSRVDGANDPQRGAAAGTPRWVASLGVAGLVLWKAKWLIALAFGKAKFLLLGLTKAKTALSMLFAASVYWSIWGWKFALGVVITTYVHEMGHVAALHRYGVRSTAPMFVPGFGAFIRAEQPLVSPRESARVGIAGPLWGLAATLFCGGLFMWTQDSLFAAVARFSAWVNLFNLLPVWQLDGARVFSALSRGQRFLCAACLMVCASWMGDILILLSIVAVARVWWGPFSPTQDQGALVSFMIVAVALTTCLALSANLPELAAARQ